MKYRLNDNFFGVGMECKSVPYKKVVNNGSYIETQDYALLEALNKNEGNRTADVIDWHLFRAGYSVLIDDDYNIYGCTVKTDGYVLLNKLKLQQIKLTKDYRILVDNLTVQQLAYIEKAVKKYLEGEIILNDNRDAERNINFENIEIKNNDGSDSDYAVIIKWYEDFEDTGYMMDFVKTQNCEIDEIISEM